MDIIYLDRVLDFVLPESQLQDPVGCYAELCELYARYGHQDEAADPTGTNRSGVGHRNDAIALVERVRRVSRPQRRHRGRAALPVRYRPPKIAR